MRMVTMPEIDKVTYCKPQPLGNWSPEEQLIDTLVKIESERSWEAYERLDLVTQVRFTYKDCKPDE